MRGSQAARRAAAAALLAAAAFAIAACGGNEEPEDGVPQSDVVVHEGSGEPSAFARRALGREAIDTFIRVGDELGLDWAIIAAASRVETSGRGAPEGSEGEEHAAAIGFTLSATGAPTDYEGALEARGGRPFAKRVLSLAERLRGRSETKLPAARLPFGVPVDGQIVAGFGKRFGALHDGLDIAAEAGEPIVAIAPGQVISTGFDPAYGNRTCVLHRVAGGPESGRRITTCYGNQSRYEAEPGDVVAQGDTIGRVGCSGPCLRPHVHLQVLDGSGPGARALNPAPYLNVRSTEIGTEFSLESQ